MLYYQKGSETSILEDHDLEEGLVTALDKWSDAKKILTVPPDFTRFHSFAGVITGIADRYFGSRLTDILPALGTHAPMTANEINTMYRGVNISKFRVHKWREDVITVGEAPEEFVRNISGGIINYSWPAQVNKLLIEGGYDLILSIGQVVPHEVSGMANYNKNIFIGTGGRESINKSHFLGAAYGMEKMMGRADTPVRKILNYASENFLADLPILYILTVVGTDEEGNLRVRGMFVGDDEECFLKASQLSLKVNFMMLDKPLKKIVVYLDPDEYKSTWLGNKSIYRTRMALANNGELIVLAPGVKMFGEDREIDGLIRKYGYANTPEILDRARQNEDLKANLSAAAHLIHGSSEERFTITYCPGYLSKEETEGVRFRYADPGKMMKKYNPEKLKNGFNHMPDGEEIFYISNPGLGLWTYKERFGKD